MTGHGYAELQALRELREPKLCARCQRAQLKEQLRQTCDRCGNEYEDPTTKQALEAD